MPSVQFMVELAGKLLLSRTISAPARVAQEDFQLEERWPLNTPGLWDKRPALPALDGGTALLRDEANVVMQTLCGLFDIVMYVSYV